MGIGYAYGKNILIGDQFVLNGVPAIVSALPFRTETKVERLPEGSDLIIEDHRTEVPGYIQKKAAKCRLSYERMIEKMGLDIKKNPMKITVGGDLLAGSGVGASAAISVSFGRACNDEFKLGLDLVEQDWVGFQGEFPYHGEPSGVDNTASSFGGIMMYQIRDGKKMYERIKPPKPLYVVLANSGVTYDTALMDAEIEALIKKDAGFFYKRLNKTAEQVYALKAALTAGDYDAVGEIMTANHQLLIELNMSHPRLIELCERSIKMGAYGAKLTGGGRGGYMVALVKDLDMQAKIAGTFEKEGVPVITAELGLNPVDDVDFRILK
ncbi:MAG: hypothetical protein IKT97_04240 [Spirochaetia bacterium]|nr:hypothetical protein [Spirochaetia bacterium]